ncbi:hypothetical protein J6590_049395 [Homalodisca vitripennis]|nr:hypothetical protein J6590_049395 [Homalodisca vitripennis]
MERFGIGVVIGELAGVTTSKTTTTRESKRNDVREYQCLCSCAGKTLLGVISVKCKENCSAKSQSDMLHIELDVGSFLKYRVNGQYTIKTMEGWVITDFDNLTCDVEGIMSLKALTLARSARLDVEDVKVLRY